MRAGTGVGAWLLVSVTPGFEPHLFLDKRKHLSQIRFIIFYSHFYTLLIKKKVKPILSLNPILFPRDNE